jgi:hypothetical protein
MPWTRLDDGFHQHPKILALSDSAHRLFVDTLNWAVANLTDGHVPTHLPNICLPHGTDRTRKAAIAELVGSGLWTQNGVGWVIHDFGDYQETKEEVRARREKWANRKRSTKVSAEESHPEPPVATPAVSKREPVRTRVPIPIPNAEATASTEREALFKAFFEFWTGRKYKPGQKMPEIERGRLNKAVSEAVGAGITEVEVRARGKVYKEKWRDLEVSPQALLANWSKFDRSKPDEEPPCPICDSRRIVGVTVEGEIVKADDPRAVGSDRCRCVTR